MRSASCTRHSNVVSLQCWCYEETHLSLFWRESFPLSKVVGMHTLNVSSINIENNLLYICCLSGCRGKQLGSWQFRREANRTSCNIPLIVKRWESKFESCFQSLESLSFLHSYMPEHLEFLVNTLPLALILWKTDNPIFPLFIVKALDCECPPLLVNKPGLLYYLFVSGLFTSVWRSFNGRPFIDLCTLAHYSCALFFHILLLPLFLCFNFFV